MKLLWQHNLLKTSTPSLCPTTVKQPVRQEDTQFSKKHPLKYPSPWQHCLSQLHQGHPTMYSSFILSYSVLRTVGCQQKGQRFQVLQQGWDQALSDFQSPPYSVPEPRGKGENYVIAFSHEWFNSSHWLRYRSLHCLQTTWGKNEEPLQPISYVIKMFANASILRDVEYLVYFDEFLDIMSEMLYLFTAWKHTLDSFIMFLLYHFEQVLYCFYIQLWVMSPMLLPDNVIPSSTQTDDGDEFVNSYNINLRLNMQKWYEWWAQAPLQSVCGWPTMNVC